MEWTVFNFKQGSSRDGNTCFHVAINWGKSLVTVDQMLHRSFVPYS